MNTKQTNKDKIYVYSSFKQIFFFWVSSAVAQYSQVLKCDYSIFLDLEMLGFVNQLLTLPQYSEHFGSFPENLLNGGVRYNEQIFPVPWHFVKSRLHCNCTVYESYAPINVMPAGGGGGG